MTCWERGPPEYLLVYPLNDIARDLEMLTKWLLGEYISRKELYEQGLCATLKTQGVAWDWLRTGRCIAPLGYQKADAYLAVYYFLAFLRRS